MGLEVLSATCLRNEGGLEALSVWCPKVRGPIELYLPHASGTKRSQRVLSIWCPRERGAVGALSITRLDAWS
jgi:hypothetical protein